MVITSPSASSIYLTGKVEEDVFLLEKNVNVFLQALLSAIIILMLNALPSSTIRQLSEVQMWVILGETTVNILS